MLGVKCPEHVVYASGLDQRQCMPQQMTWAFRTTNGVEPLMLGVSAPTGWRRGSGAPVFSAMDEVATRIVK